MTFVPWQRGQLSKMEIRTKLLFCGALIAASLAYAVYLGASSSWQYYLQVDECLGQAAQLHGQRLRLSGRVAAGSLKTSPEHREATFVLAGTEHTLPVCYRGSVPDNLAEGREVVVEGALAADGHFQCETLITRCASKYAPKETATAVNQAMERGTAE